MNKSGKRKASSRKVGGTSRTESGTAELLLEIGTEELPYHVVAPTLNALSQKTESTLKEERLVHGGIRTFGTPRRLILLVEGVAKRQAATVRETMGPSKAVAFTPDGQPTKAAMGFAASQGVEVGALEVRTTPKGEYVCAVKRDEGAPTPKVLSRVLPLLIGGLNFPKAMRWNESGLRFARPIRWLLAVYGGKTVPFSYAGLESDSRTWGHRFIGSPAAAKRGLAVHDFKSYLKAIEAQGVIPDQDRRRALILSQIDRAAKSANGQVHRDDELLEQAVYAVECPNAVLGSFNAMYLSLPKEILMTAMKEHQGYFSLMRGDGSLLPSFISIANMKLPNMRLIKAGNERVLAARLADAKFFFDEDRKLRLEARAAKLPQVVFHQKLGTMEEKTRRIAGVAERLAGRLGDEQFVHTCRRAAVLCKGDLLSGLVGEFPTLQGVMGGEYARHDGEAEDVCQAIAEQYLPKGMEGEIPRTPAGQVLSLADRLDSVVAFFHVGVVPSGSEDPFALRRHAIAIVRILVEGRAAISLAEAVEGAQTVVDQAGIKPGGTQTPSGGALNFILERFRHYAGSVEGIARHDVVEAVLKSPNAYPYYLPDLLARMQALQSITGRVEFDPLMVGFKRAHRLVEKEQWTSEQVDAGLFQHPTEADLHAALVGAAVRVPAAITEGRYAIALDALVEMKPAIDGFFVGVLVNAEDPQLRANRLSLLCAIDRLFMSFADFSQILVQGT